MTIDFKSLPEQALNARILEILDETRDRFEEENPPVYLRVMCVYSGDDTAQVESVAAGALTGEILIAAHVDLAIETTCGVVADAAKAFHHSTGESTPSVPDLSALAISHFIGRLADMNEVIAKKLAEPFDPEAILMDPEDD